MPSASRLTGVVWSPVEGVGERRAARSLPKVPGAVAKWKPWISISGKKPVENFPLPSFFQRICTAP